MPGYPALAALLRARMRTLPAPNKAPAAHPDQDDQVGLTPQEMRALLARGGSAGFGPAPIRSRGLPTARALPAKRTQSDQPAPIYQLKVGLRGATPPIWRRLEVPPISVSPGCIASDGTEQPRDRRAGEGVLAPYAHVAFDRPPPLRPPPQRVTRRRRPPRRHRERLRPTSTRGAAVTSQAMQ